MDKKTRLGSDPSEWIMGFFVFVIVALLIWGFKRGRSSPRFNKIDLFEALPLRQRSAFLASKKVRRGKLKNIVLAFVILLIWSTPSSGEIYNSPFGFSVNIPSHWRILDRQEVKNNPDVLDFSGRKNMSKALIKEIKAKILSGEVEYYFFQDTFISINVIKHIGQLPKTSSESKEICRRHPDDVYKYMGERINLYECGLRKVAGLNAFYMDYGGTARWIQYQIQKSPNVIVTLTLTCDQQNLGMIRKEFENIIASFKPHT